MYEPLYRYDPDWMIPGVGLIPRPDMATLLETNNRFIEAYLVGLNHEMARELLWREFPTDQRGTYFSSFWTGTPELVADLHQPAWATGALGSHVDRALDGQLVFMVRGDLIRRYPGVVAHAAREAGRDGPIPTFAAHCTTSTCRPTSCWSGSRSPRRGSARPAKRGGSPFPRIRPNPDSGSILRGLAPARATSWSGAISTRGRAAS
jgi:hypothetical protein